MPTLLAGAAQVVITPPVGTFLDGYGARSTGSVGVHDELHARALVIDDGATQAALVSCDLIAVDRRLVAAARELAAKATGIPAGNMLIAATHTHAGPAGLRADLDGPLTETMARLIAGAITAANNQKRPAVLKAGGGTVDSVSQNRRDPAGPADDALRVLLFDSPDAGTPPVASVVNFACHATVLYHSNMQISADYPGYAVETVRQITGAQPLFFNGACGDVNPAWIEQEYHEAERVGSIVGAEAARRLQELRPLGNQQKVWNIRWDELSDKPVTSGDLIAPRLRVASRAVPVRLRKLDPPASYDARLAALHRERAALAPGDLEPHRRLMEQITQLQGERGVAARLRPDGGTLHPEVQAIGFGNGCAILALPGEFFVETARAIQAAARLPHLLIACYANHHVFYVVPRHEFERGGYEPGVSMLDESAEEIFRAAALELLQEVTA